MNRKKRFWKASIALLTLSAAMVTNECVVPAYAAATNSVSDIHEKDARFAALVFVVNERHTLGERSGWFHKSISVSGVKTLLNPDHSVEGYLVEFTSNGVPSGWAVVSDDPNDSGVMAYSDTGSIALPTLQSNQAYTFIPRVGLDVITFGKEVNQVVTQRNGIVKGWRHTKKLNVENQQKWNHVMKLEKEWTSGLGATSSSEPPNGVTSADPESWILDQHILNRALINGVGIHDLLQDWFTWGSSPVEYPGCTPTSGAMLMWFWADNGRASLFPAHSAPSWQDEHNLIWALRSAMKTIQDPDGTGDTDPANCGPGLASYAKSHGDSTVTIPYGYTWSGFVGEIQNHKPVILNFDQPYYGSHSTFAVGFEVFYPNDGYNHAEGEQWIAQHDNWSQGIMWMDYSTIDYGTFAFQWVGFHP